MLSYDNIKRIRNAQVKDMMAVFPFICASLCKPFYKEKYKNTWVISDREDEASDNGFFFFQYLTRMHPEQKCVYAIKKSSKDYEKVKDLGTVVEYGSLKHWIIYLTCSYNISSQFGHPNGYFCTLLELLGAVETKNVFLQHGITKDHASYLMSGRRKIDCFITGAKPEHEYVKKEFGYSEGVVQYTGFARFDSLHDYKTVPNRILIMPTWRSWLKLKTEQTAELDSNIRESEYLTKWMELLNHPKLDQILRKYNSEVIFFPHSNFQDYLKDFKPTNPKIIIGSKEEYDVQSLMKSSELMITDYSSVFFDMAYMKKNVIFYQFDEEKYRQHHYQQGWFDYHTTSFGKSLKKPTEVLDELESILEHGGSISSDFLEEHSRTFELYDDKNCERIYLYLKNKSQ